MTPSAARQARQMWTVLMQAIGMERKESEYLTDSALYIDKPKMQPIRSERIKQRKQNYSFDHRVYSAKSARFSLIEHDLMNLNESDMLKRIRDDCMNKCRGNQELKSLVEKAAELHQNKSDNKDQKETWLDAAKIIKELVRLSKSELFRTTPLANKVLMKQVSRILIERIRRSLEKRDYLPKVNPFPTSLYFATMSDNGYTNNKKKKKDMSKIKTRRRQELMDLAAWIHKYGRPQMRKRLNSYKKIKKTLESSDSDNENKKMWLVFLKQAIFVLESILHFVDPRYGIQPYAHYIMVSIFNDNRDNNRNYSRSAKRAMYEERYIRLRNEMMVWAFNIDTKMISEIIKPGHGKSVATFEPNSREKAIFWGYYGVKCPGCGDWRVREAKDSKACCDKCGKNFTPESIVHCMACWQEHSRVGGPGVFECEGCQKQVEVHEPLSGHASCLKTDMVAIMEDLEIKSKPGVPDSIQRAK